MKVSRMLLEGMIGCKLEHVANRRTGKSTGRALVLIGMAMQNPQKPVPLVEVENSHAQNKHLIPLVQSLIEKLELKFFMINWTNGTLTYNPFVEIDFK